MRFILLLIMLTTTAFANRVITLSADNTISFNQPFSAVYVAKKQQEFINLVKDDPTKEINIVLYTPGGSITAGQRFFDTIKAYPNKVNTITIFAASMGYMTVQNLGKRYILPSGILMSHRAKLGGVGGEIPGEFNVIVKF
jgi:ATP-dependent protease ClpP protease subunit